MISKLISKGCAAPHGAAPLRCNYSNKNFERAREREGAQKIQNKSSHLKSTSLGYSVEMNRIRSKDRTYVCACMLVFMWVCVFGYGDEKQETRSKPLEKQLQHFSVSKEHFYRIISYHTFFFVLVSFSLLLSWLRFNASSHIRAYTPLRKQKCLLVRSFAWQNKRRNRFFTIVEYQLIPVKYDDGNEEYVCTYMYKVYIE